MIGRIRSRLERIEKAGGSRQTHLIVCSDMTEVEEAKRFLGDRFGDLVFVATGVNRCHDEAQRRAQWVRQAKENASQGSR